MRVNWRNATLRPGTLSTMEIFGYPISETSFGAGDSALRVAPAASPSLSPPASLTDRLRRQIERGAQHRLDARVEFANKRHAHLRGMQCKV